MTTVPVSLNIDDGSPVNTFFFHDLGHRHELLTSPALFSGFAKICERHGIKGKFSVLPMPCGLGPLNGEVHLLPKRNQNLFLKTVRERIQPRFSITPELLTHFQAYNPQTDRLRHICEDEFVSRANAEEIAEYIRLGLRILTAVGLNPTGVTSPLRTGLDNEDNYAKGIGMAYRRELGRDRCFYFLHSRDELNRPKVMCDSEETGRVVSVPVNCFDPFWETQLPATEAAARRKARQNIDALLSPDGRTGKVRELFEAGLPITLITHCQSLFSDGRFVGLDGLDELAGRINRVFGRQVEWVSFAELAGQA
jgi:hypothetical protein